MVKNLVDRRERLMYLAGWRGVGGVGPVMLSGRNVVPCRWRRPGRARTTLTLLPLLAAGLAMATPAPARADAEIELFDLLMAWESVSICGFPMPDATGDALDETIEAFGSELAKSEDEMQELHEQAAWQILRQKQQMCAAEGSWRARYDQIVAALADSVGGETATDGAEGEGEAGPGGEGADADDADQAG